MSKRRTVEQQDAFEAGREQMHQIVKYWSAVGDDEKLDGDLFETMLPRQKWARNRLKAQLRNLASDESLKSQIASATCAHLRDRLSALLQDTSLTLLQKGRRIWNLLWSPARFRIR